MKPEEKILLLSDDDAADEVGDKLTGMGYLLRRMPMRSLDEAIEQARRDSTGLVIVDTTKQNRQLAGDTALLLRRRSGLPVLLALEPEELDTLGRDLFNRGCGYVLKPLHERDVHLRIVQLLSFCAKIEQERERQRRTEAALETSVAEMDKFAHIASHDLQEPLRAINGFLQLLQTRYRARLDHKGIEFIDRSIAAGRRMEQLIKELLELARVSSRGGPFTPEDLDELYGEAKRRLERTIQNHNATIICKSLPHLEVDSRQITALFYNLLANGLRYNASTIPRIEVEAEEKNGMYQFSVRDNGIGIPPEFHQRIFDVFQRLHTRQEYPGVGMGLTISKKIVERHGGSLWVESEPDAGSTFYFTLPAER